MATFTNQATLSYNDTVTSSNVVTGQLLAAVSATKAAVRDTYTAHDRITYVISLLNSGTVAFTGLTLTDSLGAYLFEDKTVYPLTYTAGTVRYYVNGVLQPTPTVTAEVPLTVTGLSIPAGGNAILLYETAVTPFAPPEEAGTIVNEVTVRGPGLTAPVTASETVTAASTVNLTITKSLSPAVITENSRLTYTFTLQNYGNQAAVPADNAVITDTFDPLLTDLAVVFNETPWEAGTQYTYQENTGEFATVLSSITVPAATAAQDPGTGVWSITPGISVLTVTGTV